MRMAKLSTKAGGVHTRISAKMPLEEPISHAREDQLRKRILRGHSLFSILASEKDMVYIGSLLRNENEAFRVKVLDALCGIIETNKVFRKSALKLLLGAFSDKSSFVRVSVTAGIHIAVKKGMNVTLALPSLVNELTNSSIDGTTKAKDVLSMLLRRKRYRKDTIDELTKVLTTGEVEAKLAIALVFDKVGSYKLIYSLTDEEKAIIIPRLILGLFDNNLTLVADSFSFLTWALKPASEKNIDLVVRAVIELMASPKFLAEAENSTVAYWNAVTTISTLLSSIRADKGRTEVLHV
ncbi:MAG: hypothetical protein Q7S22_00415 [Candidatus Micrarchaeota archaeon]|nr:hypothetical protein [Candidatus Micrarchaeota archaeon]